MTCILRYTKSGSSNNYYAIVLDWPSNSELTLGVVSHEQVSKIEMLGVKGNLNFATAPKGIKVILPVIAPNSNLNWAWVLKITTK